MLVKRIEPIEINDFFTQDLIDLVYENVDKEMQRGLVEKNDKYAYMFKFSNNGFITLNKGWDPKIATAIKNKGKELGQNFISDNNVALIFARYTHDSGQAPTLTPHADVVANKIIYTCTIRLKSSKQWDFYVKDTRFEMPNEGSSVWFTGNQDVHWRPDLEFEQDEYYDILLCQVWSDIENEQYPENHKEVMMDQMQDFYKKYSHMLKIASKIDKNNSTNCTGSSNVGDTIEEAYEVSYSK
jgi:hypothetical protein